MIFPSKTKFFEGTKCKLAKIKNLHLENIDRKVCTKFDERRSNLMNVGQIDFELSRGKGSRR